jgi:hypothetical protein
MDQRRAAILVCTALIVVGCARPSPSPSATQSSEALPAPPPPSAIDLLECDGDSIEADGLRYAFELDIGGLTPDGALSAWMAAHHFSVPHAGYERIEMSGDRAAYGYRVDGRVKVIVTFSSRNAALLEAPPTIVAPYTMEALGLCDPSEVFAVGPAHRVWTKVEGQTLDDNVGPEHCMWQHARILSVPDGNGFRHYLRDPLGVMWQEQTLFDTYAAGIALPTDAVDSGYRSGALELWFTPADTAVYVVSPDDVERWPRFDMTAFCV